VDADKTTRKAEFKVFQGNRLPNFEYPLAIVAFQQERDDSFFIAGLAIVAPLHEGRESWLRDYREAGRPARRTRLEKSPR
jgi:hypothetical protein